MKRASRPNWRQDPRPLSAHFRKILTVIIIIIVIVIIVMVPAVNMAL
jgi:hypothetical protein